MKLVRNKKVIIFSFFSIICIFLLIIIKNSFNNQNDKSEEVIRASIYFSGNVNQTYYFVLFSNKKCEIDLVERASDEISSDKFVKKIIKKSSKKLSTSQYNNILNIANRIRNPEYILGDVADGDVVLVYYKGQVYKDIYIFATPSELHNLMYELFKISPISINIGGSTIKKNNNVWNGYN